MVSVVALAFVFTLYMALVTAVPTASSSLSVNAEAALVRPPKDSVNLVSLDASFEGSGCRSDQVSTQLASDNSALTMIFDDFAAADGPKAVTSHTRALCKVNIGITSPGWAFDVTSADFRGYVYLEKGVNASLVSRWKWIDSSGTDLKGKGNIHKIVTGPYEEDFLLHKDGEISSTEATVCQKKDARIQITLSATVNSRSSKANGYVQGGSADTGFGEILNLSWKKC
ncbi:DUF4360 domain containing protein [Pyrenophora teres f. teres]|uniref:DUF4360 domain containing protein n=1 Tax=Pyrenophora teres f. teres TaxID=97479 RepID=A0A6S6WB01_9PLEO|nr:hypothetical protein PTNB29_06776 [Pyrenophora teres f. teres]CAE7201918.1 DUF4360 domain containing protein [Pyrenophora teres f. teres]